MRQVRATALVDFARLVVEGEPGPHGYGFLSPHGTVLPTVVGSDVVTASPRLLSWHAPDSPAVPQPGTGAAATAVYALDDYFATPRTRASALSGPAAPRAREASAAGGSGSTATGPPRRPTSWFQSSAALLQAQQQVTDRPRLRRERVVTGRDLHDVAGAAGELALPHRRGALVLRADEVRRGHLLPRRRAHGLLGDLYALPRQPGPRLRLHVRVAVLQERLDEQLGADAERSSDGVDVQERRGLLAAERRQALPDLRQVARDEQQVLHRAHPRRRLRGHDPAVAVPDHNGRLLTLLQHRPHRLDVLRQPRAVGPRRSARFAAAR